MNSVEIAMPERLLKFNAVSDSDWKFERIFGDDQFIAAGELLIPPGARKPSKNTKDNTYVTCPPTPRAVSHSPLDILCY